MYHPESHVVYAASGSDVRDVFVAGKALLRNYKPVYLDIDEIVQEAMSVGAVVLNS